MTKSVAAIIPSSGRASLALAVGSVLRQTVKAHSIVVICSVDNRERVETHLGDLLGNPSVTVLTCAEGPPTGGRLRRHGTLAVDSEWYGMLDDDDEWLPNKLEVQLAFAEKHGSDVVSSRLYLKTGSERGSTAIPAELYAAGTHVSDYLFSNRSLRVDRPLLHTSSLLVRHDAMRSVNWDPDLQAHQDWDLVLRLYAAGYGIGQCPEALALVETGSTTSMSATNRWRASHEWWARSKGLMTDQAEADFLVSQVLRYAISEKSGAGIRQVAKSARGIRRPSLSSSAIGLAGLVPRKVFESQMLKKANATSGRPNEA